MAKITVLGCGWGTALAMAANSNGHDVTLWSPFEKEVADILATRQQSRLLPGVKIPAAISVTTNLEKADGSDAIIVAVPSRFTRETAVKLKSLRDRGIIVNVSKGIEDGTHLRLSQVLAEELPEDKIVVLSGPSHAEEVARNIPTSIVSSSQDPAAAEVVQDLLMSKDLRIYTNDDVVGVELGGALKNIIALAAGILDGMGLGDNTKAALLTRGLSEITRLGISMGARMDTFSGLAGIGDLVVTCTSVHSRNRRFGILIGQGVSVEKALEEVGTVEGYYATKMAFELSREKEIIMPITEQCYNVLYNGEETTVALKALMSRPGRSEHDLLYDD